MLRRAGHAIGRPNRPRRYGKHQAVTVDESTPPDKNEPSGTSEIIRIFMASRKDRRAVRWHLLRFLEIDFLPALPATSLRLQYRSRLPDCSSGAHSKACRRSFLISFGKSSRELGYNRDGDRVLSPSTIDFSIKIWMCPYAFIRNRYSGFPGQRNTGALSERSRQDGGSCAPVPESNAKHPVFFYTI